jgi:hypothetical protein
MRMPKPLMPLRPVLLVLCACLVASATACSSGEPDAPPAAESPAKPAKKAKAAKKERKQVEKTVTGTVMRAVGKRIVLLPDGERRKAFVTRGKVTEVSGIKEHWNDLDVGYRVEVTWIEGLGRRVAKKVVVLSRGDNTKPPIAQIEAELGLIAAPGPAEGGQPVEGG